MKKLHIKKLHTYYCHNAKPKKIECNSPQKNNVAEIL